MSIVTQYLQVKYLNIRDLHIIVYIVVHLIFIKHHIKKKKKTKHCIDWSDERLTALMEQRIIFHSTQDWQKWLCPTDILKKEFGSRHDPILAALETHIPYSALKRTANTLSRQIQSKANQIFILKSEKKCDPVIPRVWRPFTNCYRDLCLRIYYVLCIWNTNLNQNWSTVWIREKNNSRLDLILKLTGNHKNGNKFPATE